MFDYYSYLNGEIRNLAFFKSTEQPTWQEIINKQKPTADIENRLCKFICPNWLAGLSNVLSYPIEQLRRAQSQAPSLMANLPSQKTG